MLTTDVAVGKRDIAVIRVVSVRVAKIMQEEEEEVQVNVKALSKTALVAVSKLNMATIVGIIVIRETKKLQSNCGDYSFKKDERKS